MVIYDVFVFYMEKENLMYLSRYEISKKQNTKDPFFSIELNA